jgi:hypothetical protein
MQSGLTQVHYHGTVDCLVKTVQQEGIRGIFRGLSSTLIREVLSCLPTLASSDKIQIPGSAMYFVTYEVSVRAMCPDDSPRSSVPIMIAGMSLCASSPPF